MVAIHSFCSVSAFGAFGAINVLSVQIFWPQAEIPLPSTRGKGSNARSGMQSGVNLLEEEEEELLPSAGRD